MEHWLRSTPSVHVNCPLGHGMPVQSVAASARKLSSAPKYASLVGEVKKRKICQMDYWPWGRLLRMILQRDPHWGCSGLVGVMSGPQFWNASPITRPQHICTHFYTDETNSPSRNRSHDSCIASLQSSRLKRKIQGHFPLLPSPVGHFLPLCLYDTGVSGKLLSIAVPYHKMEMIISRECITVVAILEGCR